MMQSKSARIEGAVPHVTSALAAAPRSLRTPDLQAGNAISVFGNADLEVGIELPDR